MLYGSAISQSDCRKAGPNQLPYRIIIFVNKCFRSRGLNFQGLGILRKNSTRKLRVLRSLTKIATSQINIIQISLVRIK